MKASEEIIWRLILSFPCLRLKFTGGPWPGPFDAEKLYGLSARWSTGERLCVLFVLNVWNPSYAKHKRWDFNLFDFVGTADDGNKEALLNWISKPEWP